MKLIKESLKYEVRRYTKEDRELGYPVIFDSKAEVFNRMGYSRGRIPRQQ